MSNLLDVKDICFSYGKTPILNGISLSVSEGEYVSLVGINGSGKSTLFGVLTQNIKPKHGKVEFLGKDISTINTRKRAQKLAVVAQNQNLNFPFTCLEIVLMGAYPYSERLSKVTDTQLSVAQEVMMETGVWEFADRPITDISGGEQQRVLLARAFMQKPKMLLLDEAMSELDISTKYSIIKLIQNKIKDTGMSVLSIHHDLSLVYKFSDKVAALKDGKIFAYGNTKEIMTTQFFKEVFSVDAEIFGDKGFIVNDNI